MNSRDAVVSSPSAHEHALLARLKWVAILGASEFFALSVWLDTASIQSTGLLRLALKKLPAGTLYAILGLAMGLFISGFAGWKSIRRELAARRISAGFPWALYGAHLSCLAAFVAISARLMGTLSSTTLDSLSLDQLQIAWVATGFAAAAIWFAAFLPPNLWFTAVRAGWLPLLAALPVTVAAFFAGRETRRLWDRLAEPTMVAVDWLLRAVGESPVYDVATSQFAIEGFQIKIHPHCSGYEGVGMMAVFSLVYLFAMREQLRFPQAWLLVPLAMAASWFGNVLRIALLMEVGAKISPEIALGGFHSQAGWLFLILISGLTVGVAQRSRFFSVAAARGIALSESPVAACLVPFLLWNIIGIISALASTDSQASPWYPVRFLAVALPAVYWRKIYARVLAVGWEWPIGAGLGVFGFAVWMVLEFLLHPTVETSPQIGAVYSLWFYARVAGSCAAIPFIEELAFRGYLFRRVQSFRFDDLPFRDVRWPGWIVSATAFGALHGERWLAGIAVGLIFALAARVTGRLSSAVISHATVNILLTIYVVLAGDYARWH